MMDNTIYDYLSSIELDFTNNLSSYHYNTSNHVPLCTPLWV